MIIGTFIPDDKGRTCLLLGLSRENMARLMAGNPIRVNEHTHKNCGVPADLDILIIYGETELMLKDHLQELGLIGKKTNVRIDPRLRKDQN